MRTHLETRSSKTTRTQAGLSSSSTLPVAGLCVGWLLMGWLSVNAIGCQPRDLPASSYFDERIQPVLRESCVRQNTGCHLATPEGTAAGNLDLSSYDAAMRRDDVFNIYGPYAAPLALLKPGDPIVVRVETFGTGAAGETLADRLVSVETNVAHAGGSTFDLGTEGYALLQEWIRNGHTRTGAPDRTLVTNIGACVNGAGSAIGYDPAAPPGPGYDTFVRDVQPVFRETCAGGNCHGNPVADLYLACGDNDAEVHWNYWVATQFVSESTSISELLRRPLSTLVGGTFHEGGNVIGSTDDPRYQVLFDWIDSLPLEARRPVIPAELNERGLRFFANRVQPMLVREGCMFLNCHSPAMFHDLRLRGGSGGHFGRLATIENYRIARELLALDAVDPNESRIIAKNLYPASQVPGAEGLAHRGGSLFEDFGALPSGDLDTADPTDCAAISDADLDTGDLNTIPAYCILARWHEVEREEEFGAAPSPIDALVWVNRPVGVGRLDDFETYRGGARLMRADASIGAGDVLALAAETELSSGCGFPAGAADIRQPAVSWDGTTVAFAARTSASAPYRIYTVGVDGSGCAPVPGIAPASDMEAGIRMHDMDPAWAADGRLIFASTRGYLSAEPIGEAGPSRTPASLAPNSNLFIRDEDGTVRQLTFQLNQELAPSFMTDGRLIFTAEKRELDFHQFAGRRLNLDGGDYHPLFAQRDSVGFNSATEIVELFDRNLAFVASNLDAADGAGVLGLVNRSIGPDQSDRPADDRSYISSLDFPVGTVDAPMGAFRSPAGLPTGHVVISCDRAATSLTAGNFAFRLCDLDLGTGTLTEIGGGAGATIDVVPVIARADREVFISRLDEANGHTLVDPTATDAEILITDFPMLATLLFTNTREGRHIRRDFASVGVHVAMAPPDSATTLAGLGDVVSDSFGMFYRGRRDLGAAPLAADGSLHIRIPGGAPIQFTLLDAAGAPLLFAADDPFMGEMVQREHMSFYPGERSRQSLPRNFFNALCGGCHGSITNRELEVSADVDIFTSASPNVISLYEDPIDLRR